MISAAPSAFFAKGARVHPDDLELRNSLGLALIEVRDFEAAIAEYQGRPS